MRNRILIAVLVVAGAAGLSAAPKAEPGARITGEYVEARTAEVFAGGSS